MKTENNQMKVVKNGENEKWCILLNSYLDISLLSCYNLIEPHQSFINQNNHFIKIENVIFPILFNVKHGIELSIKYLTISCGKDFEQIHDIKSLFSNLDNEINSLDKNLREHFFKIIFPDILNQVKNNPNLKLSDENKNKIPNYLKADNIKTLDELKVAYEEIINKYQELKLFNKYLSNKTFNDKKNIICKYPENLNIDYLSFGKSFNIDDIKEIARDIEIFRFYTMIIYLIIFNINNLKSQLSNPN